MKVRIAAVVAVLMAIGLVAQPALASHTVDVRVDRRAVVLSPRKVRVTGTLVCAGQPEDATPRVGLLVWVDGPPRGLDGYSDGYGYSQFINCLNETLPWRVIVDAAPGVTFSAGGWLQYEITGYTPCYDWDYDCPNDSDVGYLQLKKQKG